MTFTEFLKKQYCDENSFLEESWKLQTNTCGKGDLMLIPSLEHLQEKP